MIEYDNPNFNANLSALVQGMWYSELPELIDLDRIYNNFESVLRSRWAKIEDAKMRIHEFQKSDLSYIPCVGSNAWYGSRNRKGTADSGIKE